MTTATVKAPVMTANNIQRVTERVRSLLTLLNLHFAGVAVLAVALLYLLVKIGAAWTAAHSDDAAAMAQQTVSMKDRGDCGETIAGAGCEADGGDRRGGPVLCETAAVCLLRGGG